MSAEMRRAIDIIDQFNQAEKTLLQIASLGIGFEAEGAVIATTPTGTPRQLYVMDANARLSDEEIETLAALKDDGPIIEKLVELAILRRINL